MDPEVKKPVLVSAYLNSGDVVLVNLEDFDRISDEYGAIWALGAATTWGDMRRLEPSFDIISDQADNGGFDVEGYIEAIEAANGIDPDTQELEERWAVVRILPFAGIGIGDDAESDEDAPSYPADDSPFEFHFSGDDPEMSYEIELRSAMMESLIPEAVFNEFNIVQDTTLDGYLGLISSEDFDAVVARLNRLGFEIQ
jgi:hypothetical protein